MLEYRKLTLQILSYKWGLPLCDRTIANGMIGAASPTVARTTGSLVSVRLSTCTYVRQTRQSTHARTLNTCVTKYTCAHWNTVHARDRQSGSLCIYTSSSESERDASDPTQGRRTRRNQWEHQARATETAEEREARLASRRENDKRRRAQVQSQGTATVWS